MRQEKLQAAANHCVAPRSTCLSDSCSPPSSTHICLDGLCAALDTGIIEGQLILLSLKGSQGLSMALVQGLQLTACLSQQALLLCQVGLEGPDLGLCQHCCLRILVPDGNHLLLHGLHALTVAQALLLGSLQLGLQVLHQDTLGLKVGAGLVQTLQERGRQGEGEEGSI